MTIPTTEPAQITSGDYVQWKRKSSACVNAAGTELKASDGWVLSYAMVKENKQIQITGSADGDDHLVTLTTSDTAAYEPGIYHWQAYLTGGSSERYTVDNGTIVVLRNLVAETSGHDARSHVKQVLDALEARLLKRADKQQGAIILANENIGMMPIHRVLEWRDKYRAEYQRLLQAEAVANGEGHQSNVYVRFG